MQGTNQVHKMRREGSGKEKKMKGRQWEVWRRGVDEVKKQKCGGKEGGE